MMKLWLQRIADWWRTRQERRQRMARARRTATALLSELRRLGFQRTVRTGNRETKIHRIEFAEPLLLTPDELWCPVDLSRLPAGYASNDLRDQNVIRSLSDRVHMPVRFDQLANGRLAYVARIGGNWPAVYPFASFAWPAPEAATPAPPLAIPLGVDQYNQCKWVDLETIHHLLVAGSTGGGKTTLNHAAILTLLERAWSYADLWLIDLKSNEFSRYRRLMANGQPVRHIAVEPEDAVNLLNLAIEEIRRRSALFRSHNASDCRDYQRLTGESIKRIVIFIDEFAMLTMDRTRVGQHSIGSWATQMIAKIAALGRSAGVCIVVATQTINKEVMSGMIRSNLETRISFSCADRYQSQLIVESSAAEQLPNGRAILRAFGQLAEVQTCWVTPDQVRLEVSRLSDYGPQAGLGDGEMRQFVRDAQLLLDASSKYLAGSLAREKVLTLDSIRNTVSWTRYSEIMQRLEADGVVLAGGPRKSRRIAPAFLNRPDLIEAKYLTPRKSPVTIEGEIRGDIAEPREPLPNAILPTIIDQ
jgi:DNA polymerase III delta prime subunit